MAGLELDLDSTLEAAAIEHLMTVEREPVAAG
jgi:hypothetical protein